MASLMFVPAEKRRHNRLLLRKTSRRKRDENEKLATFDHIYTRKVVFKFLIVHLKSTNNALIKQTESCL